MLRHFFSFKDKNTSFKKIHKFILKFFNVISFYGYIANILYVEKIVFCSHFMYLNYQIIFVVFCFLRLKCVDEEQKL